MVDSTNKCAAEILSKTTPSEGTCIFTDFQTDGQGQIGRYWFSDRHKNITASYILYPKFIVPTEQFILSMAVSLAVSSLLENIGIQKIRVKWPNDIYAGDKKIAGILIQNQLQGNLIKHCITGIGININQEIFPSELPNPTSVFIECGEKQNLNDKLNHLSFYMEKYYLKLKNNNQKSISEEYAGQLYRKDAWFLFKENDDVVFEGKIRDVQKSGKLNIEHKSGIIKNYAFREISFLI